MTNAREKGKRGEREAAKRWGALLGLKLERVLDQARDGGHDIKGAEPLVIEVKRRKTLKTVYGWMQQAATSAQNGQIPALDVRADGEEPLVVVRFYDLQRFVEYVETRINTYTRELIGE